MMAIDFPDSPSVNDTFTAGGKVYQWDGTVWEIYGPNVSPGTFKIDDVNNRVGIGTPTPEYALHVDGDVGFNDAATANFFVSSGTGANLMPSGTTAERPASPTAGMFRFNETTGEPEWYSPVAGWLKFRSGPVMDVAYLVVAGGGGGGATATATGSGGGGGAGGYRNSYALESSGGNTSTETVSTLTIGSNYTVSVGAGGTGATTGQRTVAPSGSDSVFADITAVGGGGGGASQATSGADGGSGGGGGYQRTGGTATVAQGYNGGSGGNGSPYGGGGGGGAGGVGASTNTSPAGGVGLTSSITGVSVFRAGGGGGGCENAAGGAGGNGGGANGAQNSTGSSAPANLGGGGGGAGGVSANAGGNGGSGVVILRYSSDRTINLGVGLTATTSTVGAEKVTTITAGTGTVSWS
jgi:hypothetical protein